MLELPHTVSLCHRIIVVVANVRYMDTVYHNIWHGWINSHICTLNKSKCRNLIIFLTRRMCTCGAGICSPVTQMKYFWNMIILIFQEPAEAEHSFVTSSVCITAIVTSQITKVWNMEMECDTTRPRSRFEDSQNDKWQAAIRSTHGLKTLLSAYQSGQEVYKTEFHQKQPMVSTCRDNLTTI